VWGFDGAKNDARPSESALAEAKSKSGIALIEVKENTLTKLKDGVSVNLSAIAKGFGVDAVSALIDKNGFTSHMVEIGGEVFAKGTSEKERPFTPLADALATTAMVIGESEMRALLKTHYPKASALFISDKNEKLVVTTTEGFPTP